MKTIFQQLPSFPQLKQIGINIIATGQEVVQSCAQVSQNLFNDTNTISCNVSWETYKTEEELPIAATTAFSKNFEEIITSDQEVTFLPIMGCPVLIFENYTN